MNTGLKITEDMLLPDVVARYPNTRAVLDRYGLSGCGGPHGPREQIAWFARLHCVPADELLRELNHAANAPVQRFASEPSLADMIYRPFFIAAVATVLTLGCMWGAINLLNIGLNRNFNAANYSWVLAHAHAMVFGFVGLFIMGFAYQAFPRFKHTKLWRPKVAFSTLPLMIVGIVLQTVAHLIVPSRAALPLQFISATTQTAAVVVFATAIIKTARQAQRPEGFDRCVYAGLGWFLVAAIANPFIFKAFELPGSREQLLFNLATFNIPYRDVQLLGIAVVMILGVSLRLLPHAYGLREPSPRWRALIFWGVNGAILTGAVTFIAGMASGNHWLLMVQWLTTVVMLVIALGMPRQFRLFGPVPFSEHDRGLKFIRAAYVWFIIAMGMLVFTPIYNFGIYMRLTGSRVPFSHAYFGAYRHALTVGFIMMMIVGVSSKVVPTLSGVDVRRARSLWATFLLLNLGNTLRVSSQIATDFFPTSFYLMGVSGFIEVFGLAIWGFELFANIHAGRKLERTITDWTTTPFELTAQTKVAAVLERYPETLPIFLQRGFAPLANPLLRRTTARAITIEQACRREGVDFNAFFAELNTAIAKRFTPISVSLPVIDPAPQLFERV